jgi:4'-phosphopantetheinyl transferase
VSRVATPGSSTVTVWYWVTADLDEEAVLAQSDVLSDLERARGERFLVAEDRRDFAAAHVLLRHALSSCAPIAPAAWQFASGQNGKPFIAGAHAAARTLAFNLSHTRGLVACAVGRDARVGIDVERARPVSDLMGLARRYFAPPEALSLEALPGADRVGRFVELWTLKESYLKATGSGLAAPLERFWFDLSRLPELRFSTEDDDSCDWHFTLAAPTPHTRLALAVDGGVHAIDYRPVCAEIAIEPADTLKVVGESPTRTTVL